MAKDEPEACMPCRGTGKVISNLGGESKLLTCPWCEGGGARTPGVDAQAAWLEAQDANGAGGESPAEAAA